MTVDTKKLKVWSHPNPPAPNNDNWQFIVTVEFENGTVANCNWLLSDLDLQELAARELGRQLKHDSNNRVQQHDLDENWFALQDGLNKKATDFFRSHPSQLPNPDPFRQ